MTGVMLGGIYSLVALGFVVIYKSTGILNFAQGQMLAVGAFILWSLVVRLSLPLWAAGLLGAVCTAILGFIIERLTIRPMTGQPIWAVIVMTVGLGTFFDGVIPAVFGGEEQAFPHYFPIGGVRIWELSISYEHLYSFLAAWVMVGFFLYFFYCTRWGLLMRAVADGHDRARSCGIKVGTVSSWAWMIAAVSAMTGGFLIGSIESVSTAMVAIALRVFPVIILGGLDSIIGCIVAGAILGALQMLAVGYADPLTEGGAGEVVPSIVILLTLIFRPHGIFGKEEIERI